MRRRVFSAVMSGVMLLSLVGCSGNNGSAAESKADAGANAASAEQSDAKSENGGQGSETDWPKKSINLIVPYSAGGDTDYNARTMAQYLGDKLGVSVVVTNVTGSGGSIAANQVHDAAPDGYTVLVNHASLNLNTVTQTINWDYTDLEMGCIFAMGLGEAIVVRGDAPWNSIQDLIEDSKANPGTYNCAATTGATTMWAPVALQKAGAQLNVIDAGGASDRIVALLGGHTDIICNSISSVKDYLATGQFKVLATCTPERSEEYPDIPTLKEEGIECEYNMDYTFLFPGGTDPAIAEKLAETVDDIVKNNEAYQKSIYETYQQKPISYSKSDSEIYWADELSRLMELQEFFIGKQ